MLWLFMSTNVLADCKIPEIYGLDLGMTAEQIHAVYPDTVMEINEKGVEQLFRSDGGWMNFDDEDLLLANVNLKNHVLDNIFLIFHPSFKNIPLKRWHQEVVTVFDLPKVGWKNVTNGKELECENGWVGIYQEPHEDLSSTVLFSRYDDE